VYGPERASGEAAAQARIAELERMVGRLALELETVKKASNWLTSRGRSDER